MNQPQRKSSFSGPGLGLTAVLGMVLCCATPALVAGGLLASVGAVIRSPVVIVLGVFIAGGAVVFAAGRRRRSANAPQDVPGQSSLGDETKLPTRPPR